MSYIPEGYDQQTAEGTTYWLAEQPGDRATALVMVVKRTPGEQRIIAEMSYIQDGVEIVDALRRIEKIKKAVHPDGGVQAWTIVDEVIEILEDKS